MLLPRVLSTLIFLSFQCKRNGISIAKMSVIIVRHHWRAIETFPSWFSNKISHSSNRIARIVTIAPYHALPSFDDSYTPTPTAADHTEVSQQLHSPLHIIHPDHPYIHICIGISLSLAHIQSHMRNNLLATLGCMAVCACVCVVGVSNISGGHRDVCWIFASPPYLC